MPYALRLVVLLNAVVIGTTTDSAAQRTLELDLSTLSAENSPRTLPAGTSFLVVIRNRVPGQAFTYVVSPILEERSIPPLSFPGRKGPIESTYADPQPNRPVGVCKAAGDLEATLISLYKLSEEEDVPETMRRARDLLKRPDLDIGCGVAISAIQDALRETIQRADEAISVPAGFNLTLVITRTNTTDNTGVKNWTVSYTGRSAGEWVTTYGFTFLTDFPWGSSNESFLAAETATQGRYVIEQDSTRERLRFVPTIFYTWHPAAGNISPGLS
ncbi:MAG: hypothetical protein H0T44_10145, partial [Gemmatimonadales bacterium]|nr:hypothetical protein [Gemmatimonadales bacterium]